MTITLSANSLAARKAAEPAYQAILAKYQFTLPFRGAVERPRIRNP